MSRLRDTAGAIARGGVLPVLPLERLFAIEHVAAGLDRRIRPAAAPRSIADGVADAGGADALSTADLRRAIGQVWSEPGPAGLPDRLLQAALARGKRSVDRAVIEAYLGHFPVDHAAFATLRDAARMAAERHDWRWRAAGRAYPLWEADAVMRCRALLRAAERPDGPLRAMGLTGRLADGAFATMLAG